MRMNAAEQSQQQVCQFNHDCSCVTFDRNAMRDQLLQQPEGSDLAQMILSDRPNLFADSPVFVAESAIRLQASIIAAIERVIAIPAYQQRVLAYAPSAACFSPKAGGVFYGYDFHIGGDGPKLIEINSNAGGMLLIAGLLRAQVACCGIDGETLLRPAIDHQLEQAFIAMFQEEWRLERGEQPLRTVAIVDQTPNEQFLYPEFLLFQQLFRRHGIEALICDPVELSHHHGVLWFGKHPIDLVYNRLTDFGLQTDACQALRQAYLQGNVVVTPHPRAHALYADKRNLTLLTDESALAEIGVDTDTRQLLINGIAKTVVVDPLQAEALWANRRHLFFKPAAGYGGKAAYRGDKLTKRVFEEVLKGDYVAQAIVPPSERRLNIDQHWSEFKFDLRNYVYQGQVQLIATRLYQGQTTNFRTPGGGFAPVVVLG